MRLERIAGPRAVSKQEVVEDGQDLCRGLCSPFVKNSMLASYLHRHSRSRALYRLLPPCLGCSAARLALGEPQRQRRVSPLETEPGRGDTEQSPRGRQGARSTRSPSASAATAEQTPWPAEKPRRKAAGRNSSGTRRRRSFWAGPVVVGVSKRSTAFAVGALAFSRRRIRVRGHCGQFGAHGAVQGVGDWW